MSGEQRLGILGGTFDPIHIGHLAAAEDVAHALSLQRVLFVPNRQPSHKPQQVVSAVEDRVSMVELAIADNPLFVLSRIELDRPGPSYSLDTLRQLRSTVSSHVELVFVLGYDALDELHTWHEPDTLLEEFRLAVLDRPSGSALDWRTLERRFPRIRQQVTLVHVGQLEVSGRDIRQRVAGGRPYRYFVPHAVARYIAEHRLYRETRFP